MPLVKRNIEPRHLCRGALPEGITSELECVTNNTLSAIIRQLSILSKHAEDIFGELFNEANTFYLRANSLQDRVDRLAVKVTQLDSTVEEVSLQDINMRKAFKSSRTQDQQAVSKNSIPNPVVEIYNQSDKPPPLNILSPYRDDKKDGLKFYTDPSYFFDLWKEKMLQDTEDKRKEKRRQKEQKRVDGSSTGTGTSREVKNVRKARNRRQEWNMMAYDKELRPDNRLSQNIYQGASSEGSLSPDNRSHGSDLTDFSYPATPSHSAHLHHLQQQQQAAMAVLAASYLTGESQQHLMNANQVLEHDYRPSAAGYRQGTLSRPQQPPPPPPPNPDGTLHAALPPPPADYGMSAAQMMEYYGTAGPPPPPPAPLIPSAQTAFVSPMQVPAPPPGGYAPPPPPPPGPMVVAPPPPGPPPLPPPSFTQTSSPLHEGKRHEASSQQPASDARSDLLAAIRMGIQLKKGQEQREQEAKREPVGNDVATILSRRIAVEYSDSDDDSEFEDNEWSD
ncbi:actin-binding protein WASF3-like isoform X1 [Acipenser ruthenus]|uniref:actin-binding protein WASF3-like isoform X1 n=1 Tax=Acipenser ruthenus TaxID=7906 RepID=UPI0027424348|nr:actin-binding protein WASF3-like isoform X1 [Acipenser ruthenus]XP_058886669.1 actin-binding protein WASF3-like isoform X1 [Acipenser ruthenus]